MRSDATPQEPSFKLKQPEQENGKTVTICCLNCNQTHEMACTYNTFERCGPAITAPICCPACRSWHIVVIPDGTKTVDSIIQQMTPIQDHPEECDCEVCDEQKHPAELYASEPETT